MISYHFVLFCDNVNVKLFNIFKIKNICIHFKIQGNDTKTQIRTVALVHSTPKYQKAHNLLDDMQCVFKIFIHTYIYLLKLVRDGFLERDFHFQLDRETIKGNFARVNQDSVNEAKLDIYNLKWHT